MVTIVFNKRSTCFTAYFTSLTSPLQMGITHVFHLLPFSILKLFNTFTHTLLQHTHFAPAVSSLIHLSEEEFMLVRKNTSPLSCPGHTWIVYWDMPQMLCPTSTAKSAGDVLCSTRGVDSYIPGVKETLFQDKYECNIFSGEGTISWWTCSTFWDRKPLSSQKHC